MNNMKKPQIRFKGFTDDWEQRKLGDIADVTKLAGFEFTEHVVYSDKGNIIALRGLNIKNGQLVLDDVKYIDGSNFAKLNRSKLFIDDIMFTYVGTVGEVAIIKENDRFYLAPNVSRIRVQSNDSSKFISHYMRTDSFYRHVIFPLIATSSQPALSMENIRKFEICLPKNRDEQDKLSEFFDGIDNLITLHQRKYEKLQIIKKSMLENCFPKNGEKVPKIRFSGFTGDWEQRKVGEVIEDYVEKTTVQNQYPVLTSSQQQGIVLQEDYFADRQVTTNDNVGYYVLPRGYFTYRSRSDTDLFVFNRNNLIDKGIISYYYPVFRPKNVDSNFLLRRLNNGIRSQVSMAAEGTGQHVLAHSKLKNMEFLVPSVPEQKLIGAYFEILDHLITLHQSELEKLQKIKKSLLERMFV